MHTHIFLDNSNIFGGAQRAAGTRERKPWPCVRVDYQNLFRLLVHQKSATRTSMLAGSVPPGNEALWSAAREAGFDTTLLRRVEQDNGRLTEQGVDEAIHLRIADVLLDVDTPGMIVLATGDGATTPQGSSFVKQVARAARRGWQVEIWSWAEQLSSRLRNMGAEYPNLVKIRRLDEWYYSIVFIKGGIYSIDGTDLEIPSRSCTGLNLTENTFRDSLL